jgi:hypothetical protein
MLAGATLLDGDPPPEHELSVDAYLFRQIVDLFGPVPEEMMNGLIDKFTTSEGTCLAYNVANSTKGGSLVTHIQEPLNGISFCPACIHVAKSSLMSGILFAKQCRLIPKNVPRRRNC